MKMSITDQLQYITARIEVFLKDGRTSTGTGYFMKLCEEGNLHIPVIVTNKHVILNGSIGRFVVTYANEDNEPIDEEQVTLEFDDIENRFIMHPSPEVDLAVMPIQPLLEEVRRRKKKLFYIPLETSLIATQQFNSELSAVEDILMIGYPNGIWDSVNNQPIVRRGITATHPAKDYNGKKEFVIDAACFPGSSGSPVVLLNLGSYASKEGGTIIGTRFKFLGTLYAGPQHTAEGEIVVVDVPTQNVPVPISRIPNNLGYVIKAERLLDFEPILSRLLN